MRGRDRFGEHRIRGSLERHVPSAEDDDRVHRLAEIAYHERGSVLFTEADLEAMPWQSRELILSEASRIYGRRR